MTDQQLLAQPRPYQEEGVEFLCEHKRVILADEQGVGKTGQAYLAWKKADMPGPAIILARANAQSVWLLQAPQWGVQTPQVISGTQKQRAKEWADVDSTSLVTTTLESFKSDYERGLTPKRWGCIIYDQYQRLLVNRKNLAVKFFKQLEAEYVFLLSGSPLRRNFADLWAPLNILDRRTYPSYWQFVQAHGLTVKNNWGAWEILGLRDPHAFAQRISKHYLRREKKDVLQHLPPKQRVLDHVLPMLPLQQKMYDDLTNDMLLTLSNDTLLITPSQLSQLTRLRQILVSPKLIDPQHEEYGALLEDLGAMLEETNDHHFVVFTPFTKAIPVIKEYLERKCNLGPCTFSLQGGMKAEEVNETIAHFHYTRGVCICSIQYSEAFDLVPASWAYFCGFSWSTADNIEAEDRLHRFTTQAPVSYYYPQHQGGVDRELIMPVIEQKAHEILQLNRSTRALREALIRAREHKHEHEHEHEQG